MVTANNLVLIWRFDSPWDAYLAAGRLDVDGITSFVVHPYHIWAKWPLSFALGCVKVQVHRNEEADALRVMRDHVAGNYQELLADEFPETYRSNCEQCGSHKIKKKFLSGDVLLLVFLFMFGCIFPIVRHGHSCLDCEHSWQEYFPFNSPIL